jgi:hypothetical protein
MAEVLVQFTTPVISEDGHLYMPQACGGISENGLWEGWIEFTSENTGEVVRSARETTQPNRNDTLYWAKGLTEVYLEGALKRALGTPVPVPAPDEFVPSNFPGPATGRPLTTGGAAQVVLDPINTYAQGEDLLRKQLSALSRDNLINIVKAYRLDLGAGHEAFTHPKLVDGIVSAVKQRVGKPRVGE